MAAQITNRAAVHCYSAIELMVFIGLIDWLRWMFFLLLKEQNFSVKKVLKYMFGFFFFYDIWMCVCFCLENLIYTTGQCGSMHLKSSIIQPSSFSDPVRHQQTLLLWNVKPNPLLTDNLKEGCSLLRNQSLNAVPLVQRCHLRQSSVWIAIEPAFTYYIYLILQNLGVSAPWTETQNYID